VKSFHRDMCHISHHSTPHKHWLSYRFRCEVHSEIWFSKYFFHFIFFSSV